MMRFDSKVALVTGSGGGIGRATARLLAEEGAKVVVAGRNPARGEETVALVVESGGEAAFVKADITDPSDTDRMAEFAAKTFGHLDIVHANAGVNLSGKTLTEDSVEAIEGAVRINLLGALYTCRSTIPVMARSGGGAMVLTASRTGIRAQAKIATYSATKAAVINLVESLALECAPLNIRVNAVAPGITMTEFFKDLDHESRLYRFYELMLPLKRWGQPSDIAKAVAFLVSDDASWVTGTTLTVDGGHNLRQGDLVVDQLMAAAEKGAR